MILPATNLRSSHGWYVCVMNQTCPAGVAQGEPSCPLEIHVHAQEWSASFSQNILIDCNILQQRKALHITVDGEEKMTRSTVGTHSCRVVFIPEEVGTFLLNFTAFCNDGSTNTTIIYITVTGRCVHVHEYTCICVTAK